MFRKIIIAIIVVAIAGGVIVFYLFNLPHKKVEEAESISIAAVQLEKEYAVNEQEANAKYLKKAIEVSGVITEIDKNQDGGIMMVLMTGDSDKGVQCTMREKGTGGYVKGQQVVVKGFCSDYGITGVTLTDCIVNK